MEIHIAFQLNAQMKCVMTPKEKKRKKKKERLPSHNQSIISETCASSILCKLLNVSPESFYEFAIVFYNYVIPLAEGFDRLDVVFNHYFKNSSKARTRKG